MSLLCYSQECEASSGQSVNFSWLPLSIEADMMEPYLS